MSDAAPPDRPPTLVHEVGEALGGAAWKAALGDALGMGDRNLRRLASGQEAPSPGLRERLAVICEQRAWRLAELARRLRDGG